MYTIAATLLAPFVSGAAMGLLTGPDSIIAWFFFIFIWTVILGVPMFLVCEGLNLLRYVHAVAVALIAGALFFVPALLSGEWRFFATFLVLSLVNGSVFWFIAVYYNPRYEQERDRLAAGVRTTLALVALLVYTTVLLRQAL